VQQDLHQPPMRSVSWSHTGALLRNKKILQQCEQEYFQNTGFSEYEMPDATSAGDLTNDELFEALRACKGLALRNEIYANDNSDKSSLPYSASTSTVEIRLLQPKDQNKHASFFVIPTESVSYGYERNPADPRITQTLVLE